MPTMTGSGESVLLKARSTDGLTVVVVVDELLAVFGSGVAFAPVDAMLAEFVINVPDGTLGPTATV